MTAVQTALSATLADATNGLAAIKTAVAALPNGATNTQVIAAVTAAATPAQVNAQVAAALATYDTATNVEVDAKYALLITALAAVASDAVALPLNSLAQVPTWNSDGTVNYLTVSSGGNTYRKTYSYSGGNCSNISAWVKQ